MHDDGSTSHHHDHPGRDQRGGDGGCPSLDPAPPPVDAYRSEIEINDAAMEYQLRMCLQHFRGYGRNGMVNVLNEALREHSLLVVEWRHA